MMSKGREDIPDSIICKTCVCSKIDKGRLSCTIPPFDFTILFIISHTQIWGDCDFYTKIYIPKPFQLF